MRAESYKRENCKLALEGKWEKSGYPTEIEIWIEFPGETKDTSVYLTYAQAKEVTSIIEGILNTWKWK